MREEERLVWSQIGLKRYCADLTCDCGAVIEWKACLRARIYSVNSLSLPWLIGCLRLQDSPVFTVVGRKGRESHRQRSRYLCAV